MNVNENLILVNLVASNKIEALQQLAQAALKANVITEQSEYLRSVVKRELEISTNMGNGIAIPHGRSNVVITPYFAFAKMSSPIQWNEESESNVDLIFMLGVPESSEPSEHLRLLSKLAGKLVNDSFVDSLRSLSNQKEAVELFSQLNFEEE